MAKSFNTNEMDVAAREAAKVVHSKRYSFDITDADVLVLHTSLTTNKYQCCIKIHDVFYEYKVDLETLDVVMKVYTLSDIIDMIS